MLADLGERHFVKLVLAWSHVLEALGRGDALEAGRLIAAPILNIDTFGQLLFRKLVYVV